MPTIKPRTGERLRRQQRMGRRIQAAREQKGVSLREVGESFDRSHQWLHAVEKGDNGLDAIDAFDLADYLEVPFAKGGRERRIPFGDKAARAMKEYLRVRPQSRSTAFWLTFRGTPMTYGALNEMLKHLGEYAGVEHVHPHRFRHTAASAHYRRHNDMKAVQNFLGHSKVATTEKYLRSLGFEYGLDLETPDAWLA